MAGKLLNRRKRRRRRNHITIKFTFSFQCQRKYRIRSQVTIYGPDGCVQVDQRTDGTVFQNGTLVMRFLELRSVIVLVVDHDAYLEYGRVMDTGFRLAIRYDRQLVALFGLPVQTRFRVQDTILGHREQLSVVGVGDDEIRLGHGRRVREVHVPKPADGDARQVLPDPKHQTYRINGSTGKINISGY